MGTFKVSSLKCQIFSGIFDAKIRFFCWSLPQPPPSNKFTSSPEKNFSCLVSRYSYQAFLNRFNLHNQKNCQKLEFFEKFNNCWFIKIFSPLPCISNVGVVCPYNGLRIGPVPFEQGVQSVKHMGVTQIPENFRGRGQGLQPSFPTRNPKK